MFAIYRRTLFFNILHTNAFIVHLSYIYWTIYIIFLFTIKLEIVALIQMFMAISIGCVISRVFFKSFPKIFK